MCLNKHVFTWWWGGGVTFVDVVSPRVHVGVGDALEHVDVATVGAHNDDVFSPGVLR